MCLSRRARLRLVVVALVAGAGLAQLGARSWRVDAIDLGTLGGTYAIAYGVNGVGHVVGSSTIADGQGRAFLWREGRRTRRLPWDPAPVGEMTDLGTLPGMTFSMAYALNDHDQVVGVASATVDGEYVSRAFVWERGRLKALDTLPGFSKSWALDINERGQIAGYLSGPPEPYLRAVVWQRGIPTPLPAFPGDMSTWAGAINASGEVAGMSEDRPVIWRHGVPAELGTLPGYDEYIHAPTDINLRGQVLGTAYGTQEYRCVLWSGGAIVDLGMLPGYDKCYAESISDLGEVVGYLANSDSVMPFIWQNGMMTDLNAYVPPESGWHLWFAMGINGGAIVGRAGNATGGTRAYRLLATW